MRDRFEAEELILDIADMVRENRTLRKEIARLQKVEEEYNQSIIDRCRASEEASQNMLRAALVGIAQGKDDMELARDLVNQL